MAGRPWGLWPILRLFPCLGPARSPCRSWRSDNRARIGARNAITIPAIHLNVVVFFRLISPLHLVDVKHHQQTKKWPDKYTALTALAPDHQTTSASQYPQPVNCPPHPYNLPEISLSLHRSLRDDDVCTQFHILIVRWEQSETRKKRQSSKNSATIQGDGVNGRKGGARPRCQNCAKKEWCNNEVVLHVAESHHPMQSHHHGINTDSPEVCKQHGNPNHTASNKQTNRGDLHLRLASR